MSKSVKFKKEELLGEDDFIVACLVDEIVDQRRWETSHKLIFEKDGKYYRTYYDVGSTEMQEHGIWEYESEIKCYEVEQVEKMVKVWEDVK